ncbi:MAG TPA: alpha/beta fold hydrolase [Candidatus Thermoplasmatota archaeon]|nr:alpha/beta fold hydrolase [Candidatus Thermoplasmatota archaeon]
MDPASLPIVVREMPFRRTSVEADGVRLNVVDDGPRDAPTLLALHGNPTWSFLWRKLIARGLAEGYRVVAPDLAGFGLSDKPRDPRYYGLARHVANVRRVVESLDVRRATLVLHDWGGPVGMGLAVAAPERVERLVIANTLAFAPKSERSLSAWHAFFASRPGAALGRRFNLVARTAFAFGARRRLDPDVLEAYLAPLRDPGARLAASRFVQMVPDGPSHPEASTLAGYEADYPKLASKPVLVLWADRDPVMPARLAERWRRDFPNAVVRHVSRTAGHFWQEDDPAPFHDAIFA